jgi:hypothetical protein
MNYAELDDELKRLEARVALALARALGSAGAGTGGGLTPPANGSWAQPAWFINPTAGSDTNNGTTSATPLKTWRALVALWGTTSPILGQSTTITFQGAGHSDNSDPVIFTPRIKNGATITITGSLSTAPAFSGVLAGTTAKNRATPQLLLETLPAGAAAGQLVVNTTHPSRAFVYKASGGNWLMTQPMLTPAPPFALATAPVEVNTWANGDAVSGYTTTNVNLVDVEPLLMDDSALETAGLYVTQLTGYEPFPGRNDYFQTNLGVVFVDCYLTKTTVINPTNGQSATSGISGCGGSNSWFGGLGVLSEVGGGAGSWLAYAGVAASCVGGGFVLDADIILSTAGTNTKFSGGLSTLGLVYFDTGVNPVVQGNVSWTNANGFGGPFCWGPGGQIDVQGNGHMTYPTGAGNAVATFIQTTGTALALNGTGSTAHSVISGSPDVFNGSITVTPAHLDAAAGVAGFGGNAFIPGNASISNLQA